MRNELLWIFMLLINFSIITGIYKKYGKEGLYFYIPVSIIAANIQVLKTINIFGMTATLGNIIYATTFLITDILSENHTKNEAKKAVEIGFISMITFTLLMNLALTFVPNEYDFAQKSMEILFKPMVRILIASLLAYVSSQTYDVWAYDKLKQKTNKIWIRNNGSTMISQLIDSLVFTMVAFVGTMPFKPLMGILISTYVLKWIVALVDTPFLYLVSIDNKKVKVEVKKN
ncbi:MAG: hypothetical protein B6I28_05265 [Fusobacteriia bacterium 4572_132]|nr:MAG: hypothetical protein B6I28_05265 [Fusobacteriia bacterium 4572_132]